MSKIYTGGPAFPHDCDAQYHERSGMTLRDYFAAEAMKAMAWTTENIDVCATRCFRVADAMLKAREQQP